MEEKDFQESVKAFNRMTGDLKPSITPEDVRCPACGYTEDDKRIHMDHHLCSEHKKKRGEA